MSELRNQVPVVLSTDLILELLANGYTRFQDENTFENESIESFLLEHFSNTFKPSNVRGQIKLMFSEEPLKGKRTQKVERKLFEWGVAQIIEEIPVEFNVSEEKEVELNIQEEKSDTTEELVIEKELAPWEAMG